MTWTPIVGKKFSVPDFAAYVAAIDFKSAPFKPLFATIHNTGAPTRRQHDAFAQRTPPITDEQWMRNLASYYQGLGWHAGPHLFVVPDGVCIFTPLTASGVHTPSWNFCSWGVEMVGDYDSEPFMPDVRDNAVAVVAILHRAAGLSPLPFELGRRGLHFHHEDPRTTHSDCPGKNVSKPDFVERVMAHMETLDDHDHPADRGEAVS